MHFCRCDHQALSHALADCRIDVTTNLFFDSYGGSSPVYQNCYLMNSATPKGASVRRSHPAYFMIQGWGYPATGSWYYLGWVPGPADL